MVRSILATLVIKSRQVTTTVLEVAGLGLIVAGVDMIDRPAAWITAGVGLILIGALAA